MLKTRFEWSILIVVVALVGGMWVVYSQEPPTRDSFVTLTEAPIVGYLAPTFTLDSVTGELVDLATMMAETKQPIVLNFWATWCGPCRIEMPHLQQVSEEFNGRITILGINQGESATAVANFQAEFSLTYPLLIDNDNQVNSLYLVRSLPTTIFIDADGIVQEVIIGTISRAVLEDRIDDLLAFDT